VIGATLAPEIALQGSSIGTCHGAHAGKCILTAILTAGDDALLFIAAHY
jgi:hypothetical protein